MKKDNYEWYDFTSAQTSLLMSQMFTFDKKKAWENNTLSFYIEIKNGFNYDFVDKAFQKLLMDNDSLRLKIVKKAPYSYKQRISEYKKYNIERINKNTPEIAKKYIDELYNKLINPLGDKLFFATSIEAGDYGILFVRISHFLVDGYSVGLLVKQFIKNYKALESSGEMPQTKIYSIKTFFKNDSEYQKSDVRSEDKKYWLHIHTHQPHYKPVAKWNISGRCEAVDIPFDDDTYGKINDYLSYTMISFEYFMFYVTARTIYQHTKKNNFCIVCLSHGRRNFVMKNTVGCMHEVIPIYFIFNDGETVKQSIDNNYKIYLKSFEHGRFPLYSHTPMTYPEAIKNKFNWGHFAWFMYSSIPYATGEDSDRFYYKTLSISNLAYHFYLGMTEIPNIKTQFYLEYLGDKYSKEQIAQYSCEYNECAKQIISELTSNKDA